MKKVKLRMIAIGILLTVAGISFCKYNYNRGLSRNINVLSQEKLNIYTAGELVHKNKDKYGFTNLVYTEDGDVICTSEIDKIRATVFGDVLLYSNGERYKNPFGIIINPPEASITEIYTKTVKALEDNKKVLIIYIDGLGYGKYEDFIARGITPNIQSLGKAKKATTVFPSITDVTYTSMVTGKTPKLTNIRDRDDGELKANTLFDYIKDVNKRTVVIEGDIKILNDESPTILNLDENDDGTIDDEIFATAMVELKNKYDLMLVHFHSFDDAGHSEGSNSKLSEYRMRMLDYYIGELTKVWSGEIILTSDHGMHEKETGGDHGEFRPEDMFIPIIYKK